MLNEIIKKAREAQKAWACVPYSERARAMKRAAKTLHASVDEIVATINKDNGKLAIDGLAAEVLPAILAMHYYIKKGRAFLRSQRVGCGSLLMFNKRSRRVYEPWGIIGIIAPWNYPFAIPFSEVVMALLAGNAVLLKVASLTPHVGQLIARIFESAGLPVGLFNYIEMPGAEAGPAFIESGIDKLFFTGSSATGRLLMALAAPRLLPLVLELGGADAAIVREDADLDRVVNGVIWAGFSNGGQSCGGIQRVLVHKTIYRNFLEKLSAKMQLLREGIDLGPLASEKQKRTVEAQVQLCLDRGAIVGSESFSAGEGNYFPAIALTEVPLDCPALTEEIFGPVVAIVPVDSDEDALRIANASCYGLTASVWSRNRRLARRLAARVNAGAVMINDHLMSHGLAETPWGGFGASGLGRTHGAEGFREMLKAKVIVDDLLPGVKRDLWWQPYSDTVFKGIRAIVTLLTGSIGEKLRSLPAVLRVFFRYWEK